MMNKVIYFVLVVLLLVVAGCGVPGPVAPANLTVTSTSPITLSWSSVSSATSYNVYRGTVTGGLSAKTLLSSNVTVTSFTDTTASIGITYYYQVTSVDTDGESAASNEVNAVSQSQTGGSFVLTGTSTGSQINLNWSLISGAVSYNVYRGTVSSVITSKTRVATALLTTTYRDTAVATGTTYYYQVTAVDANSIEVQVSTETPVTF
jgi:fibronectin type 3 domain-containing protein